MPFKTHFFNLPRAVREDILGLIILAILPVEVEIVQFNIPSPALVYMGERSALATNHSLLVASKEAQREAMEYFHNNVVVIFEMDQSQPSPFARRLPPPMVAPKIMYAFLGNRLEMILTHEPSRPDTAIEIIEKLCMSKVLSVGAPIIGLPPVGVRFTVGFSAQPWRCRVTVSLDSNWPWADVCYDVCYNVYERLQDTVSEVIHETQYGRLITAANLWNMHLAFFLQ